MLARALAQHEETGRASAALRAPRPPTKAGGRKFARVCGPSTPCRAAQRCAATPPPAGIAPQIARFRSTPLPVCFERHPFPLSYPPPCRHAQPLHRPVVVRQLLTGPSPARCHTTPHHTTPRRAHARAHARARFAVHPRVVVNALTGSLLHLRHQDAPGVVPDQEGGGYVRRERGLRSGGCGAICAWIPPSARSAALRLRAAGLPPQAATAPGLRYQVVISYPRMPIIMRPLSRRAAGAGAMLWPQRRRAAEHARCGGARSFAMGAPADAPLLPAQASRRARASRGT